MTLSRSSEIISQSTGTPLVSVLMLCFNQQSTIDEAIRSVMLQKAPFEFELVIANDCSTDATESRAEAWVKTYPGKITLISRRENLGLQRNLLDAYSRCRGKYIAICEGDDFWCSRHKLRRQAGWMENHPETAICFHRVVNYYADTGEMSLSNGPGTTPRHMTVTDLAKANLISNVSVMYRALPHTALPRWIEQTPLTDYALHMLHASQGDIRFMPQPMAVYRRYSRGIWSGDNRRALELARDVRQLLIGHFAGREEITGPLSQALARILEALRQPATESSPATPPRRSLLSRLRASLSRHLPPPRIK